MKRFHVHVSVNNLEESIRFYSLLGLVFPEPEGPYIETTLSGGIRLSLNDLEMVKSFLPEWEEPKGQRIGLAPGPRLQALAATCGVDHGPGRQGDRGNGRQAAGHVRLEQ